MQRKSNVVRVTDLPNIGPTIEARLAAVGIKTAADLRRVGAAEAYKRMSLRDPLVRLPVCYNLYSLQAALDGIHWNSLSSTVKRALLASAGVNATGARKQRSRQVLRGRRVP